MKDRGQGLLLWHGQWQQEWKSTTCPGLFNAWIVSLRSAGVLAKELAPTWWVSGVWWWDGAGEWGADGSAVFQIYHQPRVNPPAPVLYFAYGTNHITGQYFPTACMFATTRKAVKMYDGVGGQLNRQGERKSDSLTAAWMKVIVISLTVRI